MNKFRSHNCAELTDDNSGKDVKLYQVGFIERDHGNLLFIDIRDHYGLTQCVIENKIKILNYLKKLDQSPLYKLKEK